MITIVIQGKLERECYDFYVENYKDYPVIISTWENTIAMLAINNIPDNFTIIENKFPEKNGYQNFNLQVESTLAGLKLVKTEYVIKMRGDEYYSNIEYILEKVTSLPQIVFTSPVFFRAWKHYKLHISDHLLAGTTDNIKKMFRKAKNTKLVCSEKKFCPEQILTIEYLALHGKNSLIGSKINQNFQKEIMKEYFEILDLNELKDYKITTNILRKVYKNNFDFKKTKSIESMNEL
jgi:hypothetical protein